MNRIPDDFTPLARVADLVTTELNGEVLVYDLERDHIHHLGPLTATVWRLCTGKRSLPDLVLGCADAKVREADILEAMARLEAAHLLASPLPAALGARRQSRRRLLRQAAIAGGVSATLVSISAPDAAAAVSGCMPADCDDRNECTEDICTPDGRCLHTPRFGPCNGGAGICEAGNCQPNGA
jgi:hypothetical protein